MLRLVRLLTEGSRRTFLLKQNMESRSFPFSCDVGRSHTPNKRVLNFIRYGEPGYFQIDNNGVENAIRPLVVGRKNYLFSGNDSGAEDNCIFYTLLGSCLQAGVDPHKWLTSTLEKIPTLQTPINWEELLP